MCSLCCLCTYPATPISNRPLLCAANTNHQFALPRHGLKAGGVTSASLREKMSPIYSLSQSGKSVWDSGTNPFWGEQRNRAAGGMIMPPKGVQGDTP